MNNNLQVFNYNNSEVRTVIKDGDPWFVLKDVCKALGIKNSRMVSNALDADEKDVSLADTLGGRQNATIINESGLYTVILRSDKPEAKPFRKWVTSEVLPSIRKHGAYLSPEALEAAATDPSYLPQLVATLKSETDKRLALEAKIQSDAAKVMLVESACREPVTVERFADFIRQNTTIKVTREKMFNYLRKNGYLIAPYDFPAEDSPYFEVSESVSSFSSGYVYIHKSLKITTEGQLFFLDKLLKGGR